MTDTVLGGSCQCVASENLRNANPAFCANVCLKLNMLMDGVNAVLRDQLPLLSVPPTIIIGADLDHPWAPSRRSQQASGDIQKLPNMLRELFHVYYDRTKREPDHAEDRALRKAFKMIANFYSPLITDNVGPGTVVESGVLDPHRFDFFSVRPQQPPGDKQTYDWNNLMAEPLRIGI
ncbi:hypothetical protein PHYSODRAFT_342458 [Phytophthora sojae]|uniref:Piwi domain-containing protein n=1 Tax=Phytophthora sojae (strain P6497) TaxID=1094619 RepID=G5AGL6_PHYSP|nr:hypothetical protein PHYSODRAFT_342458 [Phytophthora sojae]EGZ05296.1 hypothetical protein PHYSODRAFT_342458 [Phytophthora sojae]|eukprot:XP_009539217.1 hypothetical protein PHYSODRAFT_342458 [Phytophthora sojae]